MKKSIALVMMAVLLVAASVMGTLAYLTSKDSVTNTFTVGKVKITLDEAKVNEYGEADTSASRVKENTYKLMPGHTYIKDPTVTVKAGSEKSYVRLLVTINKAAELKEVFGDSFLPQNYVTGWDSTAWPCVKTTPNDDNTVTYEFRYKDVVSAGAEDVKLDALFDSFSVPGENMSADKLEKLNGLKITVVAHAIQADGSDTADEAWAKFGN